MRTSINILLVLLCTLPLNSDVVVVVGRGVPAGGGATATDSFERTSANPMSLTMSDGTSTWVSGPSFPPDCQIVDNSDLTGTAGDSSARVATPAFNANQKATITFGTVPTGCGVIARMNSATDIDCYLVYTASTTILRIYKITDDGAGLNFVQQGADIAISAVGAGDTIGISTSGTTTTTIKAFRNDVEVGSRDDSTSPWLTGQPAVWLNTTSPRMEAFAAVDL